MRISQAASARAPGAATSVLFVLALAAAGHGLCFALTQPRLHPHYFDRDADVEVNSTSSISTDARMFYGHYARLLMESGAYRTPAGPITSHMPGVSVLLAASKRLAGHLGFYGLVQALALFAAVGVFAFSVVRRQTPFVAAGAALLFLIHPVNLYQSWSVNSDTIFIAFFLLSLVALAGEPVRPRQAAAAALLLGAATYFREVGLVCALGVILGLAQSTPRRPAVFLLFAGVFLGALAPWMARNALATGVPTPATSKALPTFLAWSFGVTTQDINPFDVGEGGVANNEWMHARMQTFLAAHGFGPDERPPASFYLKHGILNYLTQPVTHLRSLSLKLVNLLRPLVALRHLERMLPGSLAVPLFWMLFVMHAMLVWFGLYLLLGSPSPGAPVLRWMLLGTVLLSLLTWAEPRYLVPFYPPLYILALDRLQSLWKEWWLPVAGRG